MLALRGPGAQFLSPMNVALGQLIARSGAVGLRPAVLTLAADLQTCLPVTVPVLMKFTRAGKFP